jgi:Tfp pilus assembly protein PilF
LNRGFHYLRVGDYDKAIKDLNKSVELDPTKAISYRTRGICYMNMQCHETALSDFNKAVEIDPMDPSNRQTRDACEEAIREKSVS